MSSIYDWSTTAANNAAADADINWNEGQAPGTVNNSARVMMKRVKEMLIDLGATVTAGGTANALTLTAGSPFTQLANGRFVSLLASASNTSAATLNVNATGAKSIRKMTNSGEVQLSSGDIQEGGLYDLRYNADLNGGLGGWLLENPSVSSFPVGTVVDFAGASAPTGWLLCFGQAVSRTTYADLFAITGTTYGVGNGSTTFNLPDLRGRVVAGQDDMGGTSADRLTNLSGGVQGDTLGAAGGSESHVLTEAQLAAHTHGGATGSGGAHGHSIMLSVAAEGSTSSDVTGGLIMRDTGFETAFAANLGAAGEAAGEQIGGAGTHTHTIASAGSGTAHNNIQPTFILNKIIKV